jgi:glycosyltransferase involved in cell wall biosynthesis
MKILTRSKPKIGLTSEEFADQETAAPADNSRDNELVRLFQNSRYYPSLRPKIRELTRNRSTFSDQIDAFLNFRESAAHILLPIDQRAEWAFFTNGDDADIQRVWAREHGLSSRESLSDILKAQIEDHRTDVFYNLDATGWAADFIKSLPGCVKYIIAWHAAPFRNVSFSDYDLVVCNFPSILATLKQQGCRTEYFFPAYDPELAPFAVRRDRPVDVLFVGGYSRHHKRRAAVLEAIAKLAGEYNIVYHLDRSRLCRLAESPLGQFLPLARHRRPSSIRAITKEPTFGRDYYQVLSAAKIVLNGSIDMAAADRGNMRCFEALGSGSLLLSDRGNYPEGMKDGQTIATYNSPEQAVTQVKTLLADSEKRLGLARAGHEMVSTRYSKETQWKRFEALVASI